MIVALLAAVTLPGQFLQRTMGMLERGEPVKILFYGQSITAQAWDKIVIADLKRRFPKAQIDFRNLAMGGFAAPMLKLTAAADVEGYYPDLTILHDYGGEDDYAELVRNIRQNTTTELLIQTDHISTGTDDFGNRWHDWMSGWQQDFARQTRCGSVDVRLAWRRTLQKEDKPAGYYLSDGIHLNAEGEALMAKLVGTALVRDPQAQPGVSSNAIRSLITNTGSVEFAGNRVEVTTDQPRNLEYRIDGQPPTAIPELVRFQRASAGYGIGLPALLRVDHTSDLVPETWTAALRDYHPATGRFAFTIRGSVSGEQGNGTSDTTFRSPNGRVVIEPVYWNVRWLSEVSHQNPPDGFEVTWKAAAFAVDQSPTSGVPVVVASGLRTGPHRLTISGLNGASATVRVFRPDRWPTVQPYASPKPSRNTSR